MENSCIDLYQERLKRVDDAVQLRVPDRVPFLPSSAAFSARSFEILDCKQIKWPAHGAPINSSIQYVDGEYMKEDELDLFIDDPTDYLCSIYLPRVFGALKPLENLPSIKSLFYQGYKGALSSALFTSPEIAKAFEAIYKAGLESARYFAAIASFEKEMEDMGYTDNRM